MLKADLLGIAGWHCLSNLITNALRMTETSKTNLLLKFQTYSGQAMQSELSDRLYYFTTIVNMKLSPSLVLRFPTTDCGEIFIAMLGVGGGALRMKCAV